jgi:hypothetical protein
MENNMMELNLEDMEMVNGGWDLKRWIGNIGVYPFQDDGDAVIRHGIINDFQFIVERCFPRKPSQPGRRIPFSR